MADSETTWKVLQVLLGEDVRNVNKSQRFNFKLVRVCGMFGHCAWNIASNVRFKVDEVHAVDKQRKLLLESATRESCLLGARVLKPQWLRKGFVYMYVYI